MKKILFHKYELMHSLGTGAMGEVMLARDLHLNQLVAIKKTRDVSALTERELLKRLEHKGLPKVYDFFQEKEGLYLVMEYIEGISLKQYLHKHGRVPFEQAVKWAQQLADILKYLHNQRPEIIYRDLKPANIMVRQDGELKLIDLGAAFHFGQPNQCAGTPAYSAPEQWQAGQIHKTCDIYSLGTVLHEMLTCIDPGQPPYLRRPVREYDKSIPVGLERIVSTCTHRQPTQRFQTMEQLEKALKNYQKQGVGTGVIKIISCTSIVIPVTMGILFLIYPLIIGIPQSCFPFPYLQKPILFFSIACIFKLIIKAVRKKRQFLRRIEKSIWLTEKAFSGLFIVIVIVISSLVGGFIQNRFSQTVYAGDEEKKLWVEMRGQDNRKLLLKEGNVYEAEDRVRLEIPVKQLPEGKVCIQLVAAGQEGEVYISRIFHVKSQSEQQ